MKKLFVLFVGLPLLAACGFAPSGPPSTFASTPAPTTAERTMASAGLARVLPTLSDLPGGFARRADDDTKGGAGGYLCGAGLAQFQGKGAHASRSFQTRQQRSYKDVVIGLAQFRQQDRARALLARFDSTAKRCRTFMAEGARYVVTPTSAARMGDQSAAYRLTTRTRGLDVDAIVVIARSGRGVVTALSVSAGAAGSTAIDPGYVVTQTLKRYRSTASP